MQRALAGPRTERPPARSARAGRSAPAVLHLHRMIGNRAVAQLLRRPTGSHTRATARKPQLFVHIKAEKQGVIAGDSTVHGQEHKIEARGWTMAVKVPSDVATGQPTGRREYSAISFQKNIDGATPALLQALTTNEALPEVTFEFVHDVDGERNRVYQRVTLTGARVIGIRQQTGDADDEEYEEVRLVFSSVRLENLASKTSTSDDWTAK